MPIYYSEDGVRFEQLEPLQFMVLGPTAWIEKPGFVVPGVGPDTLVCRNPDVP